MQQFEKFTASFLYCPRCKKSMPVREVLLLVLPEGDLYDYRCVRCGESLGTKQERKISPLETGERRQDGF